MSTVWPVHCPWKVDSGHSAPAPTPWDGLPPPLLLCPQPIAPITPQAVADPMWLAPPTVIGEILGVYEALHIGGDFVTAEEVQGWVRVVIIN